MLKPVLLFLAFLFPCGAEEFPDINELFSVTSLPGVARRRANAEPPKSSALTINLEKLDINRFKKKLKELENIVQVQKALSHTSSGLRIPIDRIESPTFESRKQFIKYLPREGFIDNEYDKAFKYQTKLKFMDLMLQLVYQARHKMNFLSRNAVFKVDKPFKMSYMHAKMRSMVHKLRRIFTTQYQKCFIETALNRANYPEIRPWAVNPNFQATQWLQPLTMLNFHEKMVREHTNVVYLYRKIMTVHIEDMELITEPNTVPPAWEKYTEEIDWA